MSERERRPSECEEGKERWKGAEGERAEKPRCFSFIFYPGDKSRRAP